MEEKEKKKVTKTPVLSNKEIAQRLAKNPSWILTHLELDDLSNVLETGKTMLPEKAKKKIETAEKELQLLKEKYS